MPANFTIPLITVISGQTITASLWNNEWENVDTNFNPAGMDDYSATDSQMQTASDPFPAGATSRPTSLQGEIERLRYQLANILGETYWYNDPDATIAALTSRVVTLEALIVAGTKMVFYQAAAPTGWTAVAVNDKFLRVVTAGGTGGTSGGSGLAPSSTITLAHSHTVASHTHSIASESSHTHSTPAHTHTLVNGSTAGLAGGTETDTPVHVASAGAAMNASSWGGGGTHTLRQVSATTNSGEGGGTSGAGSAHDHGGATGAATPATDSQLSNIAFQYADIIVATKD